jgi:hypothetical protein
MPNLEELEYSVSLAARYCEQKIASTFQTELFHQSCSSIGYQYIANRQTR